MLTRKVAIALDFDRTFTSDVEFWREFVKRAVARGHKVYCVTCRTHNLRNCDEVSRLFGTDVFSLLSSCVFTNHLPKRIVCEEQGIHIDIWIDDTPDFITAKDAEEIQQVQRERNTHETLPIISLLNASVQE